MTELNLRGFRVLPGYIGAEAQAALVTALRDVVAAVPLFSPMTPYGKRARMGLHQDRDEANFNWPVLSISLGDEGLLRIGGTTRGGSTVSHWLRSGDVVVMGGDARLIYHGVDRIRFGSSTLLSGGGRINLTLRVVE